MKKLFTPLALSLLSFGAIAQVTTNQLLLESFRGDNVDPSLSSNQSLNTVSAEGFDGLQGVGELSVFLTSPSIIIDWTSEDEIDPEADSVLVEFELASNTEMGQFSFTESSISYNQIVNSLINVGEEFVDVQVMVFGYDQTAEVVEETEYATIKKVYKAPYTGSLNALDLFISYEYFIGGEYVGGDANIAASSYCNSVYENPNESAICQNEIVNQLPVIQDWMIVDNISVTEYKLVTGIEDKVTFNEKEVFGACLEFLF